MIRKRLEGCQQPGEFFFYKFKTLIKGLTLPSMAIDSTDNPAFIIIKERDIDCPGDGPCRKLTGRTNINDPVAGGKRLIKTENPVGFCKDRLL